MKRFTTTGNNRPGKAPGQKLTLTDREVRLFRRHIRKYRHLAVTDLGHIIKTNFWKGHFRSIYALVYQKTNSHFIE